MTDALSSKAAFRKEVLGLLRDLPETRRSEGQDALLSLVLEGDAVLSFSSLTSEVNTDPLNARLCREGRLVLPRIREESLALFRVPDLAFLLTGPFGLREPDPSRCPSVPPESITTALIPALAFNSHGYRLGRGGGHYDRLLTALTCTIGIGFREQKLDTLPLEPHDLPVSSLFLV